MISNHIRFGFPFLLSPASHHHHSLAHIFFSSQYMQTPLQPTSLYFLGYFSHLRCTSNSFLIMSSLVTPPIHLNIPISATSNFFSCGSFTAHVLAPYFIAPYKTPKTNQDFLKSQTFLIEQSIWKFNLRLLIESRFIRECRAESAVAS